MKFTQEQFKIITGKDDYIHLDDLPFENLGLDFFNGLPQHIQSDILQWGYNDTVVKENLFEFIVEIQFGMTIKQYYESSLFKKFMKDRKPIPFNYYYLS
jgi:hypothetical protein